MSTDKKLVRRTKIRYRIRKKAWGTAERPRLAVFRSNKEIYAQLIDDLAGHTLAAASSRDAAIAGTKAPKVEVSKLVGEALAEKAKAAGISNVTFDRGGYLYHGRVKALAEGAREKGLNF
jgi:large subunit ribosomal protein L18